MQTRLTHLKPPLTHSQTLVTLGEAVTRSLRESISSSPLSHPHYQEQALPLKRELVDTVRNSRSAFLLSFGFSA